MGMRGPRKQEEIVQETLERVIALIGMNEQQSKQMAEWATSPVVKIQERAKAEAYKADKEAVMRLMQVAAGGGDAAA